MRRNFKPERISLAPHRLWEVDEGIEDRRVSLDNLRVEGGRRHHADDPAQVDAGAVVVARPGYDGDLLQEFHTPISYMLCVDNVNLERTFVELSEAASLMLENNVSIMDCVHEFKVLGRFIVRVVTPFLELTSTSSSFAVILNVNCTYSLNLIWALTRRPQESRAE